MKRHTNYDLFDNIDWGLKWLALLCALPGLFIPGARIAWACCTCWIIANMVAKLEIKNLEKQRDELNEELLEIKYGRKRS